MLSESTGSHAASRPVVDSVRSLAAAGLLARAAADPDGGAGLYAAGVYDLAWPLVWARQTRRIETAKGHYRCASSFGRMLPECLDAFHDDVEAVVEYVLRYAGTPIRNIEGWISSRIAAATVDGHRRRRGLRGALQRPRVPQWLSTALSGDAWLVLLAERILEWAGVPHTAGPELWPLDAWSDLRAATLGDRTPRGAVAADVDIVLTAMRRARPGWYASYVERPLSRKQVPVGGDGTAGDRTQETGARADADEARLADLAAAAADAIGSGLAAGRDPDELVPAVLRGLFLGGEAGVHAAADALGGIPGVGDDRDRWLADVLVDDRSMSSLVTSVLRVVQSTDGR